MAAQVKALACELPAASGVPLARWTCPELARRAAASGISPAPSTSTVRRWLAADALKPWQHQSRVFPRDPRFALKASRVLDLYQREWEGQPLGDDDHVLSADEKPGAQARMRLHLTLPPGPGRPVRTESEYHRFGTLAYLAAYDVHRARVFGRCEPPAGIKPFTALVDQVMQAEPYASARRVFWVAGSGASHKNWAAAARLSDAYPNAQMVHLPVHASWLNQVEIYFSVLQRKLLTPDDFEGLDELASQILAFEDHQRDQPGVCGRPVGGPGGRRSLAVGAFPQLGGGDRADREGGHDQHEVPQDRGVEPGLALVQAEAALGELEALLDRPAQPGRPDQPGLGRHLPLGHEAVVKRQLTGLQVTADQQAAPRRGGAEPGPGVPALALGAAAR